MLKFVVYKSLKGSCIVAIIHAFDPPKCYTTWGAYLYINELFRRSEAELLNGRLQTI